MAGNEASPGPPLRRSPECIRRHINLTPFDPWLRAATGILLLGGDKTGVQWYDLIVPKAEKIYNRHLKELNVAKKWTQLTSKMYPPSNDLSDKMPASDALPN